eukprot:CAMPEP_0184706406 /NCGR_PEP_ID=MMETSP0313-20130426/36742_1 /TAXON_ID=2792 /ORGANISM="Porphyridium aerugineum, Strain SAG 1380-2" /LENGTH=761 /DNA_ID=CAMNT_0027167959 /DNA_START=509 /DNA_END=2794 /DNA_ORIENTATION=-
MQQQQTLTKTMLQFLTPKDPDIRLAQFSREGDPDKVTALIIKHNANVNYIHYNGFSCLHWAAANGHAQVAQILLDHGAIVNQVNKDYMTPLHLAAISGHESVIRVLVDRGADIDARDDVNSTPLHYAGQWGRDTVIQALLSRGADVHAKEDTGLTPLHLAAYDGHISAVRLLIAAGSNIKEKDMYGQTPLTCAKNKQHSDVVKMLRDRAVQEMKFCEAIDSANMVKSNLVRTKSAPHPSRNRTVSNPYKTNANTNNKVATPHGNLLRATSEVSDETSTSSSLALPSKLALTKTYSLKANRIPQLDSPTSDNGGDSDSDHYRRYSDGGDDDDDDDEDDDIENDKHHGKHVSFSHVRPPARTGKDKSKLGENVNDLSRHNSINSSFDKSRNGTLSLRSLANAFSVFERESSSDLANNESNSRALSRSNTASKKSVSFQKEPAAAKVEIAKITVINEQELRADQSKEVVVKITPVNKGAQLSVERASTSPPSKQQQQQQPQPPPQTLQRSKSADAAMPKKGNNVLNAPKKPAASPTNMQGAAKSSVPAKQGAAPAANSVKSMTPSQRLAAGGPTSVAPKPAATTSKPSLDNKTPKMQTSAAPVPAKSATAPVSVKPTATAPVPMKPTATAPVPVKPTAAAPVPMKQTATAPVPMKSTGAVPVKSTATAAAPVKSTATAAAPVKSTAAAAVPVKSTAAAPVPMKSTAAPSPAKSTAAPAPMKSTPTVKTKAAPFPTGLDKSATMSHAPVVQVLSPSHRLQGKAIN